MRHVYYGDFLGSPGTVVTFFPDKRFDHDRADGRSFLRGIRFTVPQGALDYWNRRLENLGIERKIESASLQFVDFDQTPIELCETNNLLEGWHVNILSDIPAEMQITGLLGTSLTVPDKKKTEKFFKEIVGGLDGIVLEESLPGASKSQWGRGSVDHIAFAVENKQDLDVIWKMAKQLAYMRECYVDRGYFCSVYLIEPGGNRIEFATRTPGFTLDESIKDLGTTFALPPRYENRRAELLRYYAKQGVDFATTDSAAFEENVTVIEGEVHRDTLHL